MDLQVLRYFSTIAREGSFLGAAQKLGYAQSNLSTKIKQLEKELGTELFLRHKQGITLTEKGEVLLGYAEKLLSLADEAQQRINGEEVATSSLTVGSMESAAVTFLPEILVRYHAMQPKVNLTVKTCVSGIAVQKVLDYELDGAFIAGGATHPELSSLCVKQEELVLLTDNTEKVGQNTRELLSRPLLVFPYGCSYRQVLETWLADEGLIANRVIEFQSLGGLLASVSAGLGIALFPAGTVNSFAPNALSMHAIPEKYRQIPIQFVWRKNSWVNSSLKQFIQLMNEE